MPSVRAHAPTVVSTEKAIDRDHVTFQAFQVLHVAYVVVPIVAGIDKFFDLLTNWDGYLAPWIARAIPSHDFMLAAGVVEVCAGLLVMFKPRIGAYIVGIWLMGI